MVFVFGAAEAVGSLVGQIAKRQELCSAGIDVYFDNVGGPLTDAVFTQINVAARIVVCGQIDQYNATRPPRGPRL